MENVFTIAKGVITTSTETCEVKFALVHDRNGIYHVETFLEEKEFFERNQDVRALSLKGLTEKGYDIDIHGLSWRSYKSINQKATLICNDHIRIVDNRKQTFEPPTELNKDASDTIYFIEIDGLRTKFADYTEHIKYRHYDPSEDYKKFEFDHTSCALLVNGPNFIGNCFHLLFTPGFKSDLTVIDFRHNTGYSELTYSAYKAIKNDFITFLSFINGAKVVVKREVCGRFYTQNENGSIHSQDEYHYSRRNVCEQVHSDYVPINYHHSYSNAIFSQVFIKCFDKYHQLNKSLDFNSLVFSLNNAYATSGLEERYFILITAFERIATNYAKSNASNKNLVDKYFFDTQIKSNLLEIIKTNSATIRNQNNLALDVFISKISNLNNTNDTATKLYAFLNNASIKVNDGVKQLIDNERNQAVHEGIVGETPGIMVRNYWKLDHILRDCILNLIGYKSHRRRVFNYDDNDDKIEPNE